MPSISNSKNLVEVRDLNVAFRLHLNRPSTLRSQFVLMVEKPLDFLFRKKDMLHVLKNVSFTANRGDRIAIIGKNGAGKTTLCRCLAGIYKTEKEKIVVNGKMRSILEPNVVIYPELTGRENAEILAALSYPELDVKTLKQMTEQALEFSGLKVFLDSPFNKYSSGMQSRLCLSVATMQTADVMILDEVFEAADKEFKEKISAKILNLIENSGTVFFVSHSEDQVKRVCNKALLLHEGRVEYFGEIQTAYEIYNKIIYEQ